MNKNTKNSLTIQIRQARAIIEHGKRVQKDAEAKRRVLSADQDHTAIWKKPHYDTITRLENKQYRTLGASARVLMQSIVNTVNNAENDFDFMDNELQTAILTIEHMGDKMPYPVRAQIAERFRGNPTALDMLLPLFEKYGYDTKAIEDMKSPFKSFGYRDKEIVGEFIGRATSDVVEHNEWKPGEVERMFDDYEKAFGLDTSVNPYAVEIENLFDTTRDRNQKLTINAYRRKYGEKLAADDPEAIEEAERLLNNGFTGEVV